MRSLGIAIAGIAVGLGVAAAGFFASQTTLNGRKGVNTAFVKGLSERIVQANTATWDLSYETASRDETNISGTFDQAGKDVEQIRVVLSNAGFQDTDIVISPLRKRDRTRMNADREIIDRWHTVGTTISVSTDQPQIVDAARGPLFALARQGIDVNEDRLFYDFTLLNDIKPDMLREATENARIAANEFAANAGVTVGGIQTASQGGFRIEPVGANPLDRKVRVVTNITFYLEN
jgi:hypothetical protein